MDHQCVVRTTITASNALPRMPAQTHIAANVTYVMLASHKRHTSLSSTLTGDDATRRAAHTQLVIAYGLPQLTKRLHKARCSPTRVQPAQFLTGTRPRGCRKQLASVREAAKFS
jgi:hypothetical protein